MTPTPFVTISMPRSGSQLLTGLLNSHPNVIEGSEILNHNTVGGHWIDEFTDSQLIDAISQHPGDDDFIIKAVGCTIQQDQLGYRPFTLTALRAVPNIRFIILYRRNQLERFRSETQARRSGYWAVDKPLGCDTPPVHINPFEAVIAIRGANAFYRQLRQIPDAAWTCYEDLCENQDGALEMVWTLLGVEPIKKIKPRTYRQEWRHLPETIANFDEVHGYLITTGTQTACDP